MVEKHKYTSLNLSILAQSARVEWHSAAGLAARNREDGTCTFPLWFRDYNLCAFYGWSLHVWGYKKYTYLLSHRKQWIYYKLIKILNNFCYFNINFTKNKNCPFKEINIKIFWYFIQKVRKKLYLYLFNNIHLFKLIQIIKRKKLLREKRWDHVQ